VVWAVAAVVVAAVVAAVVTAAAAVVHVHVAANNLLNHLHRITYSHGSWSLTVTDGVVEQTKRPERKEKKLKRSKQQPVAVQVQVVEVRKNQKKRNNLL
jgi:ABC-type sugar transport system substrate-binding protein